MINGETLTLVTADIQDEDGLGDFTYKWYRDGAEIFGARAQTYILTDYDVDKVITASVSYYDDFGTYETLVFETDINIQDTVYTGDDTYDYLDDLTSSEMNSAIDLDLITQPDGSREAYYVTYEDDAIFNSLFRFDAIDGALYNIRSISFFDPFLLRVYDKFGNVVAIDNGQSIYGVDFIYDFEAQYSGEYYVNASWDPGYYHTGGSISIEEEPIPPTVYEIA